MNKGESADVRLRVPNSCTLYLCNVPDVVKVKLRYWEGSPLHCHHRSKLHPARDSHCKVQRKDVRLKGGGHENNLSIEI